MLMTTKDGKWKPVKVTSINQTGPRSYNIVTPQGQQYRRNRKDLRKVTGGTDSNTSVCNFLDDELYDASSNELIRDNSDSCESVPPVSSVPTMRRSQRTIRAPVRYADQY